MATTKLYFLIFVVISVKLVEAKLIVKTDVGSVEGIEVQSIIKNEKYYSFMGIPYGKAPVGPLRFKAPEPHEGWSTVLNAKKEKPPCTQYNIPNRPIQEIGVYGSDDCLHLSIHTPKIPNTNEILNYPVIVFLYNEQFRLSYNASDDYGPDFFMKEDVVLVTVSHRLGATGFIAFEDERLPGNNGIRDVILALKWVQRNIHNFGGNTFGITLMGADGGAIITDILLQSPKAKGLFSRAILQSGTSFNSAYLPKSPKKKAIDLANVLEKSAETSNSMISELSTVSTAEIALAEPQSIDADESRLIQRATVAFGPSVEPEHPEAIITKFPEDYPANIDIPVMIGYNSRESLELMERYMRKPQYLTFADRDYLLSFPLREKFHFANINSNIYYNALQELKDFYFEEGYVKINKPSEYMNYVFDMIFFYSVDYAVRKYVSESNSQIYYYTFDYSGELNMRKQAVLEKALTIEGAWGASLGDELCYLFVCKPIKASYTKILQDEEAEELKVLRNMIKMWTNFAKSGNPTPPGSDFTWKPATKDNKECLVISDELQMKTNLHQDRVEFWDNFLAKYRAMAVNGVIRDEKDEL